MDELFAWVEQHKPLLAGIVLLLCASELSAQRVGYPVSHSPPLAQ